MTSAGGEGPFQCMRNHCVVSSSLLSDKIKFVAQAKRNRQLILQLRRKQAAIHHQPIVLQTRTLEHIFALAFARRGNSWKNMKGHRRQWKMI